MNKKLWLFYSSVFFQHFAYGIIVPTLIIWQHRNGLSFSEIAIIQGIGLLLLMLTEIPSSYFADKIGRKITLIIGLLMTLFAFILLIPAKVFVGFMLFQAFFSVGLAMLSGTEEAFLDDLANNKKHLTHYLGSMSVSDELGTIIGMLASSIVIAYFSITASFQLAFFAILLSLLFILFIPFRTSGSNLEEHYSVNAQSFLFSKISFAVFLLIIAFSLFAERGEMIYQGKFDDLAFNLKNLGLIYVVAKTFSILGSRMSHKFEVKLKTFFSLVLSGSFQIVAFALLLFDSKFIAVISLCLFYFSENIFRNIKSSFVLKNSPHAQRATNLSLVSFSSSAILIISKLVVGWTLDIKFLYAIIFVVFLKAVAILTLTGRKASFSSS